MLLEQMTWPEVEALEQSRTVAVCCLSATEQHSYHLPLATDRIIGSEIVRRLEQQMPQRLLALPTVWLGCSSHHLEFSGTLSGALETMQQVIRDVTSSLLRHGFGKLLFLNSHGGNQAVLALSMQKLAEEFPEATLVGVSYWNLAAAELGAIRESEFGGIGHAGELETSILLAVAPQLVRVDQAEKDGMIPPSQFSRGEMLSPPRVTVSRPMSRMSRHGGYGDPSLASAEKGERFLRVIVKAAAYLCEDILSDQI